MYTSRAMLSSSRRSRKLLLAIFNGRGRSIIQHPFLRQWPVCGLHSLQQQSGNNYSVSFGQETDELIEKYTRSQDGSKPRARKTAKSTTSSKGAPSTGMIEITLEDGNGAILATKSAPSMIETMDPTQAANSIISEIAEEQIATNTKTNEEVKKKRKPRHKDTEGILDLAKESNKTQYQTRPIKRAEQWQTQKDALQRKFGEASWSPRKKLSPDAIQGLRELHAEDPERYSTPVLADKFKVSPEAIRRILKSKWRATQEEMDDRRQRWARRHDRIWDHKAALGQRPQRRRDKEPEGPEAFEEELRAKQMLGQI